MPGVADDADVGGDPLAGQNDAREVMAAGQGEPAGRGLERAPAGEKIALEPQAIVPSPRATPADHLRGSVEAVGKQDHGLTRGQPAGDHVKQFLLYDKADGARGLLDPPRQGQSAFS